MIDTDQENVSDEPTIVEVRFEKNGCIVPLSLQWRGQRQPVASLARTWNTGQGKDATRHFLVMTAGGRLFELHLQVSTLCWRVIRLGAAQNVA